jgi:class 3 adenylate cyclase
MREVRLRECARCKFYGDCGARLTPRLSDVPSTIAGIPVADQALIAAESSSPPLEGERKTVTALFADIKGSTELRQHLDLEEARAIIDPALKIMIDADRHYGGYVQSTGDGIFALFGAPLAQEDHPQRALHAAVSMQREIRGYGDRLLESGRVPIEIRVGVQLDTQRTSLHGCRRSRGLAR